MSFRTDKPCSFCGRRGHTKMTCPDRPRKPLRSTTPLRAKSYMKRGTKPMRREAVKTRSKREATSQQWYAENPPDDFGRWPCYLNLVPDCHVYVDRSTINLEHKLSKTDYPEYKYETWNIEAACGPCNESKGGQSYINGELV